MTAKLYLEDLHAGQRFTSASVTMDEAAIREFAGRYDPQPFHTDPEAARESFFGGLAASGWHTAATTMRLLVESVPIAGGLIGGGGEVAWPRATRPGDRLHVETEILEVTPSRSRPERGMARLHIRTLNQDAEPVQVATMNMIVPRRPA